ncbi:hypothetical protein [Okeania sp. SIO2B3]|uniref:hypothetical protein n=1 Tax=Okeania sp. SIO2B3 TaxID=2607784 RepID=UPI0013C0D1DE|nr:hypothetical protein [Okeania sp. SIO2B3]NET41110.1 hypothetical protein [Okeania sp. SIO2B3]
MKDYSCEVVTDFSYENISPKIDKIEKKIVVENINRTESKIPLLPQNINLIANSIIVFCSIIILFAISSFSRFNFSWIIKKTKDAYLWLNGIEFAFRIRLLPTIIRFALFALIIALATIILGK